MSSKFIFNDHSELKGKHALFAPSQSSWLRYDDGKIVERYKNQYRTALGTEIHDFAAAQIELNHKYSSVRELIKDIETFMYCKYTYLSDSLVMGDYGKRLLSNLGNVPREVFEALKYYINDGISFKMNVEQGIKYSENFFGHADTICFRNNVLRIHDFKSGDNPAHIEQLKIYAALFCLEYGIKPSSITIILRLYQWDRIEELVINTETDGYEDFVMIIDKIISSEKLLINLEED